MDDKTLSALTLLATKLGTTSEYLWSALLRQAPISGIADIIFLALWGALLVRLVIWMNKKAKNIMDAEAAFLGWVGVWSMIFLYVIIVSLNLNILIASFANPEYWALKQIIK